MSLQPLAAPTPHELRAFRFAMGGWSQGKLAQALSISRRNIEEWETGRREPPVYLQLALGALYANRAPWSATLQDLESAKRRNAWVAFKTLPSGEVRGMVLDMPTPALSRVGHGRDEVLANIRAEIEHYVAREISDGRMPPISTRPDFDAAKTPEVAEVWYDLP